MQRKHSKGEPSSRSAFIVNLSFSVRRETNVGKIVVEELEKARDAHHSRIVGTELELRDKHLPMIFLTHKEQLFAEERVGTDATSYSHLTHAGGEDGLFEFF